MSSRRTLTVFAIVAVIVLLALGAFALWVFGRPTAQPTTGPSAAESGIVHVRTIDAFGDKRLLTPVGIGAGSDGGFFVTLRDIAHVVEFDSNGDFIRSWGDRGLEAGQLMVPLGVAVDRAGSRVYVTDRSRLRLLCYDLLGNLRWEVPMLYPLAPAVTPDGVAVTSFGTLALFDAEGVLQGEFGSRGFSPGQFDFPRGIVAVDAESAIVADTNNARVQRVQFSGELTATVEWVYGQPPLNSDDATTLFGTPASVTLDDDGYAYVLDGFRAEVTVLDPADGAEIHRFVFTTGTAPGQVYMPSGIAHLGGDTFAITDTANDRVQIFRLLLPGENTVVARSQWLLWLLLIPLLPLLLLFGRKRWFVTGETLARAEAEGTLRLLAAVLKKMYVLPEVYAQYGEHVEEGVPIGEYLVPRAPATRDAEAGDPEAALIDAARRSGVEKLLLRRHIVVSADDGQRSRLRKRRQRVRAYEDIVAGYRLDGESAPGA
ncbi:MAG: NHL repeat-containing protein [Coriobacteriia bacterium]|nr:NHL repeat-containing protein [Coriobacteriia bacterium]